MHWVDDGLLWHGEQSLEQFPYGGGGARVTRLSGGCRWVSVDVDELEGLFVSVRLVALSQTGHGASWAHPDFWPSNCQGLAHPSDSSLMELAQVRGG